MQVTRLKKIKEISKWRYIVTLMQAPNGIYIVTDTNTLSNEIHKINFADYNLASHRFETLVNSYEGN